VRYNPQQHGACCSICPLKGNPVVPPAPATAPLRLILVGEGPGRVEERTHTPFVGPSGKILDTLLAEQGPNGTAFARAGIHVTNAMLCRGELDKENNAAELCCAPRLLRELAALPEEIPISVLGKSAAKSVLGVRSILMARGFVWAAKEIELAAVRLAKRAWEKAKAKRSKKQGALKLKWLSLKGRRKLAGRTVFPSIHPAFVMRADTWKPILELDMRRTLRAAGGEKLRLRDNGPYKLVRDATGFFAAVKGMRPIVSTDIETGNDEPSKKWPKGRSAIAPLEAVMLCVGISDGARTVVVDPRMKQGDRPVWGPRLVGVMQKFYESRETVVMHNGYNFDQIVMRQYGFTF
jgi:uracil-DNA glycosylase family 4